MRLRLLTAHPSGHQHEKNLSAQYHPPEAYPRVSCAHGDETRTASIERPSRQRPSETLPVSSVKSGYPRAARLHTPAGFDHVFRAGVCTSDSCFRLYSSPNQGSARLGISVARKTVPNATARNRIKRQVRESFRRHRTVLPALDIVVQIKQLAAAMDNARIRSSLEWHWQELIKKCAAS